MIVEFPNSATVRAPERFVLGGGRWNWIDIPIRYAVFTHPSGGRCLVDTGYSNRTVQGPRSFFLKLYAALLRPSLTVHSLPLAQTNIASILLTHLHADHISALKDYPSARLYADGHAVAHFLKAKRFDQLRHGFFRELLPENFQERFIAYESLKQVDGPLGLGKASDVFGDGSVLAVPLPGHMKGHTGIVWTGGLRPLLYAADAEWIGRALMEKCPPGPPARLILDDVVAARNSAARIRNFVERGGDVVLCHDPVPL